MFEKITDLSFERNWKQAIGFYLAAFLASVLLVLVIGIVCFTYQFSMGHLPKDHAEVLLAGNVFGRKIIPVLALLSTAFAILVMRAKKAYSAVAFVCVFLAAVLAMLSLVLSLIPIAYLTTLPKSTPPQGS